MQKNRDYYVMADSDVPVQSFGILQQAPFQFISPWWLLLVTTMSIFYRSAYFSLFFIRSMVVTVVST